MTGFPRPISFASKFPRINPGASGVAVLEHMERLDAVEASLQRLGEDSLIEEADEDDQGDIGTSPALLSESAPANLNAPTTSTDALMAEQVDEVRELEEVDESDITFQGYENMVASMPHIGRSGTTLSHARRSTEMQSPQSANRQQQQLDWIHGEGKKTVIVEVSAK
jgi:hypothetical protein